MVPNQAVTAKKDTDQRTQQTQHTQHRGPSACVRIHQPPCRSVHPATPQQDTTKFPLIQDAIIGDTNILLSSLSFKTLHRLHEYTGTVDTNLDSLTCGEYTPVDASEALSEGRIIIGRIIGWGGDVIIATGADTFEVTRCVARCACKGRIIGWGFVNLFRIIGWGGDVIIVHASSSLEESAPSGVRERVPPTL